MTLLLGAGLITLLFFGFAGWLLCRVLKLAAETELRTLILYEIVGLASVVTLYALTHAHFLNTISVINVVALVVWRWQRTKFGITSSSTVTIRWKTIASFAGVYALIVLAEWLITKSYPNGPVYIGYEDVPYYVSVAQALNSTGVENPFNFLSSLDVAIAAAKPYHFFDAWWNAMLYRLPGLNPLQVYLFIFLPQTVFIGFCALVYLIEWMLEKQKLLSGSKRYSLIFLVAFFSLFLVGYFPWPSIGQGGFEWISNTLVNNPKYVYSFVLIGLGLPLFLTHRWLDLMFLLGFIGTCFVVYVPIAVVCCAVLILVEWRARRWSAIRPAIFLFLLFVVMTGVFYVIQPADGLNVNITKPSLRATVSELLKHATPSSVMMFVRVHVPKILFFIPFLLLTAIQFRQANSLWKNVLVVLTVLVVAGGIFSFVFQHHLEGFQFIAQVYYPSVCMIAAVALAATCWQPKNKLTWLFIGLASAQLGVSVIKIYRSTTTDFAKVSPEFKKEIQSNESRFSAIGLYCVTHDSTWSASSRHYSPYINFSTGFLKLSRQGTLLQAADMSDALLQRMPDELRVLNETSPLRRFIKESGLPFGEGVRAFVKTHHITFIVWHESLGKPEYLMDSIDETITDSVTGFHISFLRQ